MISIITPTYNRAKLLSKIYQCLLNQKNKDFEWIIVNDGSKDNTDKIVKEYQKKKELNIKYYKKENGGKPSAYNLGVEKSAGELLLCLDDDDLLSKDAIEVILQDYNEIKDNENIAGLVYNIAYIHNKKEIIGTSLPNNIIDTYFNIYHKYKVQGDKLQVIKSHIAKQFPIPIISGEKFIPEALINNRISLKYSFKYKSNIIRYAEYLPDGYTSNYFKLVKSNPLGNALYFKELYNLDKKLYNVYGYVLFSVYGKKKFKQIIKEHPSKFKILLVYLPTWIISKIK